MWPFGTLKKKTLLLQIVIYFLTLRASVLAQTSCVYLHSLEKSVFVEPQWILG